MHHRVGMESFETDDLVLRQTPVIGREARHNDLELLQRGYMHHPVGKGDAVLCIYLQVCLENQESGPSTCDVFPYLGTRRDVAGPGDLELGRNAPPLREILLLRREGRMFTGRAAGLRTMGIFVPLSGSTNMRLG